MVLIAIGLGSNCGDRRSFLTRAVQSLDGAFSRVAVSHLYETAPMYVLNQPAFLNAAALYRTDKGPLEVLAVLKRIEKDLGRTPRVRNGPRELDLDLLAFGRAQLRSERNGKTVLQVPHPRIPERRFVLQPLAEIAPDLVLPGLGRIKDLLAATESQAQDVRLLEDADLSLSGAR